MRSGQLHRLLHATHSISVDKLKLRHQRSQDTSASGFCSLSFHCLSNQPTNKPRQSNTDGVRRQGLLRPSCARFARTAPHTVFATLGRLASTMQYLK